MTDNLEAATAAARAAGKHIGSDARELGVVDLRSEVPERTPEESELAARAIEALREEIARVARMREQFATEKAHGAPARPSARLDAMAANIEGMCRFALRLGILTPGEARLVWAGARAVGLHDRPASGHDDGEAGA